MRAPPTAKLDPVPARGSRQRSAAPSDGSRRGPLVLALDDAAEVLDWPAPALARILEHSHGWMLPGAFRRDGTWMVPQTALRALLGYARPVFSFRTLARLLDRDADSLRKAHRDGKIQARLVLGELRVPWSEYLRLLGSTKPPRFSFFAIK